MVRYSRTLDVTWYQFEPLHVFRFARWEMYHWAVYEHFKLFAFLLPLANALHLQNAFSKSEDTHSV